MQSLKCEQLAHRDRDGVNRQRQADEFSLQFGEGLDLRLGDEAVHWIGDFAGNGDGVGAAERRLDEVRSSGLCHVNLAAIECGDHVASAAGNRSKLYGNVFACKEALLLRDIVVERGHSMHCRGNLAEAQRRRLRIGHGVDGQQGDQSAA